MKLLPKTVARTVAVIALALGTVGVTGSPALAQTEDPRATVFPGNATTCEDAGLEGEILTPGVDFTYTGGGPDDQFVTIESVSEGTEVTGIVVKGGPNYNVYVPGTLGLPADPPWEDLRSPLNEGGNIPTISNWFVCGTPGDGNGNGNGDGDKCCPGLLGIFQLENIYQNSGYINGAHGWKH